MATEMNSTRTTTSHNAQNAPAAVGWRDIESRGGRAELVSGFEAGIGAGYTMGLVAMVVSWIHDWNFWTPFNDVAGIFLGSAVGSSPAFNIVAVLLTIIIHFTMSIALGIGFAMLYSGIFKCRTLSALSMSIGLAFGLVTWFLARLVVLPTVGSEIYAAPAFLVAHLVFGATLGVLYPVLLPRNKWRFNPESR